MLTLACAVAAFRSGAVMGFLLAGNGLLVIYITIAVYHKVQSFTQSPGQMSFW